MMTDPSPRGLLNALHRLAPWRTETDLSDQELSAYRAAARLIQLYRPPEVHDALAAFQNEADPWAWLENVSRLFLVMRFVFDLPERVPAAQRHIFWGWVNWPEPDAAGQVNLSWPMSFAGGRPALLAGFEGAEGACDAAIEEYQDLLARFPFREPPATRAG